MKISVNDFTLDVSRNGIVWGRASKAKEGGRSLSRATWQSPYVSGMRGQVPLEANYKLYKVLREAIPCLSAAIHWTTVLLGDFGVVADEPLKTEIEAWLHNVNVNHGLQRGFSSFQYNLIDSLLWSGKSVAEVVPNNARNDVFQLKNLESDTIVYLQEPSDPNKIIIAQRQPGKHEPVILNQDLTTVSLFKAGTNPHGNSMFKDLPFVSEILMTMLNGLRQTWERFGSPRYQVDWAPPEGFTDPTGAKVAEVMKGIEAGFLDAMEATQQGQIKDFFSSSVKVSVIGADNERLEFREDYRNIMEQVISVTHLPSWMLGFTWSTTERLSENQADLLTGYIDGIWKELSVDFEHIIRMRQLMTGGSTDFELRRNSISLQHAVETSKASLYNSQAALNRERLATRLWTAGVYTQEQYAEHVLGDAWDKQIETPMDMPPLEAKERERTDIPIEDESSLSSPSDVTTKLMRFVRSEEVEEPSDPRVTELIDKSLKRLRESLEDLKRDILDILKLPEVIKMVKSEGDTRFILTPEQEAQVDTVIESFLARMAGKHRKRREFASGSDDGIIQEMNIWGHELGVKRVTEYTGEVAPEIDMSRDSTEIRMLMECAFDRLSDGGNMRLEGIKGDIKEILADGMQNGESPIAVAKDLSRRFDEYKGWEFERLARTEIAFAQNRGYCSEAIAEGVDASRVDVDAIPAHPNCLCGYTIEETETGWVLAYDIAATACEVCQEILESAQ